LLYIEIHVSLLDYSYIYTNKPLALACPVLLASFTLIDEHWIIHNFHIGVM